MKKKTYLTEGEVEDMVRNLYLKLGDGKNAINLQTSLVRKTFKKENFPFGIDVLRHEIERLFGSKINLDIELGFKPSQHISTIEEDIEEYRKACEKKGKALSQLALKGMGLGRIGFKFSENNINKNELDKSLGFEPLCRNKPWTQEEVIEKYRKLYKKNENKPLNGIQLKASGLGNSITKLFASREEFYKMVGCDPPYERWTRDKIIKRFKELCLEVGDRPLFHTELALLNEDALASAISKHFSSRQDLYSECGYSSDVLYLLLNGELARSTYEVYFANYLIHNEIDFQCDKIIDKTSKKNFKYDFLVKDIYGNDVYIEIWGYESSDQKKFNNCGRKIKYSEKRKIKEKFYKDRGLKLISINEDVFRSSFLAAFKTEELQERFKKILIENSIKPDGFKTLNNYDLFYFQNNRLDELREKYLKICQEKNGGKEPVSLPYLQSIEEWGVIYAIQKYAGGKVAFDESLGFEKMKNNQEQMEFKLKKFLSENEGKLVQAYLDEGTCGKAAKVFNVTASTFNKWLRDLPNLPNPSEGKRGSANYVLPSKLKRKKFLSENEGKLVQAYLDEGTCGKAAKVFNVTASTFNKWLRNLPNLPNPSKRSRLGSQNRWKKTAPQKQLQFNF